MKGRKGWPEGKKAKLAAPHMATKYKSTVSSTGKVLTPKITRPSKVR
jgi:hypothetical protein